MSASQEFDLPSGAKHVVTQAPFEDADALQQSVAQTLIGLQLSQEFFNQDATVIKDAFLRGATSPEVRRNLWRCLERTTRDSLKVQKTLFDDVDPEKATAARRDYYAMCWNVVKVNCGPFFEQVLSTLRAMGKGAEAAPKPQ